MLACKEGLEGMVCERRKVDEKEEAVKLLTLGSDYIASERP